MSNPGQAPDIAVETAPVVKDGPDDLKDFLETAAAADITLEEFGKLAKRKPLELKGLLNGIHADELKEAAQAAWEKDGAPLIQGLAKLQTAILLAGTTTSQAPQTIEANLTNPQLIELKDHGHLTIGFKDTRTYNKGDAIQGGFLPGSMLGPKVNLVTTDHKSYEAYIKNGKLILIAE